MRRCDICFEPCQGVPLDIKANVDFGKLFSHVCPLCMDSIVLTVIETISVIRENDPNNVEIDE